MMYLGCKQHSDITCNRHTSAERIWGNIYVMLLWRHIKRREEGEGDACCVSGSLLLITRYTIFIMVYRWKVYKRLMLVQLNTHTNVIAFANSNVSQLNRLKRIWHSALL